MTSITQFPESLTYGDETAGSFTVDVSAFLGLIDPPTGTVDISATLGSTTTPLCTITLVTADNGAGSCALNPGSDTLLGASVTPYQVTAVYNGDGTGNYDESTSSQVPLTVQPASTTAAVTPTPSSITFGQETNVSFGVTVSPQFSGAPTGLVTVMTGSTPLCSFMLVAADNGSGSCHLGSDTLVGAGPVPITATYGGDANFTASPASPAATLTIQPASTTTVVTPTPSSIAFGQETNVSFGVTVSPQFSGAPTGSVTVMSGSTPLCSFTLLQSDNGSGSCHPTSGTVLPAAPTPYAITATYAGDANFITSTSPASNLTVTTTSSTTVLTPSPSTVKYGHESSVSFGVTVSPQSSGAPTGLVTVMTGSTPLCTITLVAADNGSGSCALSPGASDTLLGASVTPYQLTAVYSGDPTYSGSTSPQVPLTVQPASTTAAVTPTPSSITFGQETNVSFGVTVSPQFSGAPTGLVTVMTGSTPLCSFMLVAADNGSGSCHLGSDTLVGAGPVPITATYGGDANFTASPASPAATLTIQPASTTTVVTPTPSSIAFGQETNVSFGVTVSPQFSGAPTGSVTVMSGSTPLCSFTLLQSDNGSGSCHPTSGTVLPAAPTPYAITATYAGDANFITSTSPASNLTVTTTSSTTVLTPSPSTVKYGHESSVSFGVTVSPQSSGAPTGLVTVMTGSTPLCTITLVAADNGSGSCALSPGASDTLLGASVTPYQLTAVYSGDPTYSGSTSPQVPLTVQPASTTAAVTPTPSSITFGQETNVSFGVTVSPQFSGAPTGLVTVMTGSTPLCSFMLVAADNGSGSCHLGSDTLVGAGPVPITATYGGDANFTASPASPAATLTIQPASTTTVVTPTPSSIAFGQETNVSFGVTVSPQFSVAPTGSVTVMSGSTPLCSFTLLQSDNGSGSCHPTSGTVLPAAPTPYAITATYAGDANFITSTSPASNLTVTGNSTTDLSISPSSVAYGNETSVIFTVTVTPLKTGTPTGTVTVSSSSITLCSTPLTSDTVTCSLPNDTFLGASSTPYAARATYTGDTNFNASQSVSSSLTVTKATTGTSLSVTPSPVTYGGESVASFTASTTPEPVFAGTPTGSITVAAGGHTLCTITLSSAMSCTTGQTTLDAGSYTVTAVYSGDPNFQSSSGTDGLTVDQATPSAPSINNLPGGAAEEGSFVASVATNGDGSRSVVSQTSGTCTVGGDGVTVSFLVAGTCTLTPQVSSGHNYTGANGSPQTFTIALGPRGYWLVGSDGGIFSFGTAEFYGSMGGTPLQRPVVGITPTHTKHGYWLVASDGGIFSFGDSNFFGSIPGLGLNPAGSGRPNSLAAPIVGMVPSSSGNGYFMVASDGGVFAFGDARFAGSCPGIGGCAGAAVAVMPDHSGNGYWLVTSAGAIYAFGDAPFFGAPSPESSSVVNAVATPDGHGYWILYANGAVANFGDAVPYGNPVGFVNQFNPATSIFPTTDGLGYWVASARGDVFSFGNAPFLGSMSSTPLNGPIIAAFGF